MVRRMLYLERKELTGRDKNITIIDFIISTLHLILNPEELDGRGI
jgi:hypothetical protein